MTWFLAALAITGALFLLAMLADDFWHRSRFCTLREAARTIDAEYEKIIREESDSA